MPRSWGAQAAARLQEGQARTAGALARAAGARASRAQRRGSLGHGSRLLARILRAAPAQNTSRDSFSLLPAQMLRAKCGSTARRPDNVPTCSPPGDIAGNRDPGWMLRGSEGPRPDVKVASDPVAPSHFLWPSPARYS